MANRSDFFGHLPRGIRRMIKLGVAKGFIGAGTHEAEVRGLFIRAHRSHKDFRLNRKSSSPKDDAASD